MKKLLLVSVLFVSFFAYSQQRKIDSLEQAIIKSRTDSTKVNLLVKFLVKTFSSDINRGLPYADSLLFYAKRNKNFKHMSTGHRYIGNYHMYKGEYDTAIKYFNRSLKLNDSINYAIGLYADYASIGNTYFYDRKNDSAMANYTKALNVVEKNRITKKYTSAYMNFANVNLSKKKYELAIQYFIKALDSSYYLKSSEKKRIVPVYVNLGRLFLDRKDYKNSDKYLKQGYDLAKELNFKQGVADVGLKLARSYYENNTNLSESKEILINCIQSYKELGDNPFLANAYINLGDLYIVTKELDKSIIEKIKAIKLAKENKLNEYYYGAVTSVGKSYFKQGSYSLSLKNVNSILKDTSDVKMTSEIKISLFKIKSDIEKLNGNYKEAYLFNEKLTQEIEKKYSVEKNETVNDIETKYQTEKKEKENLQLKSDKATQELQLEKENKRKQYFAFALLASLLTLGVFGFYYKRNRKQKFVIENLQKDLHHRVKNNLAIIDSLVEDIKDEFNNKAFTSKLTDLQNRIDSINEVHSQLYLNTDITNLKLKKYVEKLAKNVQQSFAKENVSINNTIDDSLTLNVEQSFPVGLIINEFLTNSFKYAFTNTEKGIVNLSIQEKSQSYILSLSDNGKGLPTNFDISKLDSFGIDVMKLLSKQLNGTFSLDGKNGVHLTIEFPKI